MPTRHIRQQQYISSRLDTAEDFINRIRELQQLRSDNQVAAHLGVSDESIRRYRRGDTLPDDDVCIKISRAINGERSPGFIMAKMAEQRARSAEAKEVWRTVAAKLRTMPKRAGAAGAVVLAAALGAAAGMPAPAQAAQATAAAGPVCIMSNRRRSRKREQIQALAASSLSAISIALGIPRIVA